MEFKVQQTILSAAAQRLQGVIDKKNTIPVLSNLLIETAAATQTIRLTGTNLETGLSVTIPAISCEDGAVTLPAQKLTEIVKELPDAPIELTIDEKAWATLECRKSTFHLAGLPSADFPNLPTFTNATPIPLACAVLRKLIANTSFAVSHDDSRYALTGVLLSWQGGVLYGVATDGHRLAVSETPCADAGGDRDIILSLKAVSEAKKFCEADPDGTLELLVSENQAALRREGEVLATRLIDAQFPDWRQVIPTASALTVTLDRVEFITALRRVATLTSDTRLVKLTLEANDTLTLAAQNPQIGEAQDSFAMHVDGDATRLPLTIGFNARYVLDWTATTDADAITLSVSDPLSPGLWRSAGDDAARCVIMPMRI